MLILLSYTLIVVLTIYILYNNFLLDSKLSSFNLHLRGWHLAYMLILILHILFKMCVHGFCHNSYYHKINLLESLDSNRIKALQISKLEHSIMRPYGIFPIYFLDNHYRCRTVFCYIYKIYKLNLKSIIPPFQRQK